MHLWRLGKKRREKMKFKCYNCGKEFESEDWVWVSGKGFECLNCFKRFGI